MRVTGTTVLLGRCDKDLAGGYRPWVEAPTPLADSLTIPDRFL